MHCKEEAVTEAKQKHFIVIIVSFLLCGAVFIRLI